MMNRREFLTTSSGLIIGLAAPTELLAAASITGNPIYSGWIPSIRNTLKFKSKVKQPYFAQAAKQLAGTGANKKALLWKFLEKASKAKLVPHDQAVGDCVAQVWGLGIDILDAIQISQGHGSWQDKVATEIIYAGGRVEIGSGGIGGDGMHGSWAARWCRDYGVLLRRPYLDGKYDFSTYSGAKARRWAHYCDQCTEWGGGVPDELEPLCKEHPVKTSTLITGWEQARDSLYNGYPIAVCSNYGFGSKLRSEQTVRDKDGFAKKKGIWFHCMLLAGMDDTGSRPGGLFINSWGLNWVKGPTRLDQPVGSFWAEADIIDRMLSQEDSFAMSNYVGYPRQNLDYHLY